MSSGYEEKTRRIKAAWRKYQLQNLEKEGKVHVNSYTVIDEYHKWQTESEEFIWKVFFSEQDSLFKEIQKFYRRGQRACIDACI